MSEICSLPEQEPQYFAANHYNEHRDISKMEAKILINPSSKFFISARAE
jgi:hypothetical protein